MKKGLAVLLFLASSVLYAPQLAAQLRSDIHIDIMTTGGTEEQQNFFRDNFIMETTAAGYTVTEDALSADYTLNLEIGKNMIRYDDGTEEEAPPDENKFLLGIHLIKNETNKEIVYFGFPFTELEEMYQYNLYLLYNAMANVAQTIVTVEQTVDAEQTVEAAPPPPEPEKWLWVGARGGMSFRFYNRTEAIPFYEEGILYFLNLNGAFQASVHLLPWLDVQAELDFTSDDAPFTVTGGTEDKTDPFISQSLTFPLLARFNLRKGYLMAGALLGPYVFVPLGQMKNKTMGGSFDYKMDVPLGYIAGINIGMKLGPGYLFLDTRWAADFGTLQRASDGANLYQRSGVTLSIGYEMGFFDKKPKKPEEAVSVPPTE
ncbi:hypothetical protein AGMMS50268_38740 [Spirochaetia bacterium]|nr:hypothetical protein AGMMS50268_38740 [Spirochaetia bacterium]